MSVIVLAGKSGIVEHAVSGEITITSPAPFQVVQRDGQNEADIVITGTYTVDTGTLTQIVARFNGGAQQTIDGSPTGGTFTGTLTAQAGGQGTLEVGMNDFGVEGSAADVGIGDIFIIAGQSNNSGRGGNNQTYSGTLKATVFGNDYVWKELVDPSDDDTGQVDVVSSDSSAAGSWLPAFATAYLAAQSVPCAFVTCATGGSGLVNPTAWQSKVDHLDRTTLYGSCNFRAQTVGAALCILWWQGETDASNSVSAANYETELIQIGLDFQTDRTLKVMACILQISTAVTPDSKSQEIRDGTTDAIAASANVLAGPDFSDQTSDDSFHFTTDAKLTLAGDRWYAAVAAEFFA